MAALALTILAVAAPGFTRPRPASTAIRPLGGQRGTEVELNLTGARLADAKEILFYQPGITVTKLAVVNDDHVKATVKLAPDCRLACTTCGSGPRPASASCATFSVGALPEVAEVEPNNDFAKPQPIAMNVTVNGVADNEDVDYFVVEAKKGERITAEVEGIRLGRHALRPLRRDHGRQAVRARLQRRRRPGLAGRRSPR